MKNIYIKTYGCQMNVYDSIRISSLMQSYNYNVTELIDSADIILLNTCHIREKASEKVYSEIGRICSGRKKRGLKKPILILAGCTGQAEGEEVFSRSAMVDIVIGPQSYHNLPELINRVEQGEKNVIELDFIDEEKFDKLPEEILPQGASSYISIQEGCNKFCHFCVVPYTRGAEFSRPIGQVLYEVKQMVKKGSKEIVLLGQNVSAYHGLGEDGKDKTIAYLIEQVAKIKEVERIRYTTSHPKDIGPDLIKVHRDEEKLMPFLNLPIQSGSNKVLKLMNRGYTRERYIEIVEELKSVRPDMVMSSDFIIGFPGEEEEDFLDTMNLVETIGFGQCYSFKYSPRPGTPAALKEQISEEVKKARLAKLQDLLFAQQAELNKSFVGTTLPVLFEHEGKFSNQIIGRSPYMQSVYLTSNNDNAKYIGQILNVAISSSSQNSLTGSLYS